VSAHSGEVVDDAEMLVATRMPEQHDARRRRADVITCGSPADAGPARVMA
jgi:hypothetical protein